MRGKRQLMSRQEREGQILRVAARVFASKGYRDASVTDIVEGARVARGTFYHYFNSKKDVFVRLIDLYFEDLTVILENNGRRLQQAVFSGNPPLYAWLENALDFLCYHRDNPHMTSLIYREAMGIDADFSARLAKQAILARKKLAGDLRLLAEHGLIIPCDLEMAATIIIGASMNLILTHILPDERCDLRRLAFELVRNQARALAVSQIGIDRFLEAMERDLFATQPGGKECAGEH